MKKYLLLTCFIVSTFGCSDELQFSTQAFQANKDGFLWIAEEFNVILKEDGSIKIVGILDNDVVTLNLPSTTTGTYTLGSNATSSAVYETINQPIYTTINAGNGEIKIQDYNSIEQTLTGTFKFNAFSADGQVVNFIEGIFYKISILENNGVLALGQLSASVDEADLIAEEVVTDINEGLVETIGVASDGSSIRLIMPETISLGTYNLNEQSDSNTYAIYGYANGVTSYSQYGTLFVTEHNLSLNIIKGSFSFDTLLPNHVSVENGTFTIYY